MCENRSLFSSVFKLPFSVKIQQSIHSFICYPFIHPTHQSSYTPIHIPIYSCTSLSIHLIIYPCICSFTSSFALSSIHPSTHPSFHLLIHPCGYPSAFPGTHLHVQNSISLSRILQCYYGTSTFILRPKNPTLTPLSPYSLAHTDADLL